MTIAIGLTENNNKLIMVDTAISTNINGKYYRTGGTEDKCFIKSNSLVFCSGNMFLADKVRYFINRLKEIDVVEICRYTKMIYNEFMTLYPNKKDINLWVWIVDKDNFWQFGTNNDFEIENNKSKELNLFWCGHFEENGTLIKDNSSIGNTIVNYIGQNIEHKKDLSECFLDIAKYYNCEAVGASVKFFEFDNETNTFKHLKDVEIDNKHIYTNEELEQISYLDVVGNVTMKGSLNIADKLKVDSNGKMILDGGNISWISHDPAIDYAQKTANNALYGAENAQSAASSAYVVATSASGNIKKLADGTYIGGTFINGTTISSPNIEGGIIAGGEFCDLNKKAKLVLNPTNSSSKNADLNLYSGDNHAMRIYDNIAASVDISSYENLFLRTGLFGTYAFGNWDFSNAEIKGIDTVAKFG
jgi:hypothetical protein